jgi:hypothetical protein
MESPADASVGCVPVVTCIRKNDYDVQRGNGWQKPADEEIKELRDEQRTSRAGKRFSGAEDRTLEKASWILL